MSKNTTSRSFALTDKAAFCKKDTVCYNKSSILCPRIMGMLINMTVPLMQLNNMGTVER